MQTFLPLPSFVETARVLDRQRLGKQRVEAKQILNTLLGLSTGWANHPAVLMWRGHEPWLCSYGMAICRAWRFRGYEDHQLEFFHDKLCELDGTGEEPPWLGDEALHASHRAALLAKMPTHYSQFGWREEPGIHYVWPVRKS